MSERGDIKQRTKMIDGEVFKMCVSKCCSRDHTNLAGETIHHTVYQCI